MNGTAVIGAFWFFHRHDEDSEELENIVPDGGNPSCCSSTTPVADK
jgi:hypothetical protein